MSYPKGPIATSDLTPELFTPKGNNKFLAVMSSNGTHFGENYEEKNAEQNSQTTGAKKWFHLKRQPLHMRKALRPTETKTRRRLR